MQSMQEATKTDVHGRESRVELVYIKGAQVNFLILPGQCSAGRSLPFFLSFFLCGACQSLVDWLWLWLGMGGVAGGLIGELTSLPTCVRVGVLRERGHGLVGGLTLHINNHHTTPRQTLPLT